MYVHVYVHVCESLMDFVTVLPELVLNKLVEKLKVTVICHILLKKDIKGWS